LRSIASGFDLSSQDLAAIQPGVRGVTIGSRTHIGLITVGGQQPIASDVTLANGGKGSAGIALGGNLSSPSGNLTLESGGPVTQSAAISANTLLLHGTQAESNFLLPGTTPQATLPTPGGNGVTQISAQFDDTLKASSAMGNVQFVNNTGLSIGGLSGWTFDSASNKLTPVSALKTVSAGDFFARTLTGNITLSGDVVTLGSNITLVSADIFQDSGGYALLPNRPGGIWQIWARTWSGERAGGLRGSTGQPNLYGCTFGGTCGVNPNTFSGDHFFYRDQPTLSINANNVVAFAGASRPDFTYTPSGFAKPDDTSSGAISGGAFTAFAPITAIPGDYPIAVATPFTSSIGYRFTTVDAKLTLLPPKDPVFLNSRSATLPSLNLCVASGPLIKPDAQQAAQDLLDTEWSRARGRLELGSCLRVNERNACEDF
jgi:hypothetical protein